MMKAKKWNFQITAWNFGKDLKQPQMGTKMDCFTLLTTFPQKFSDSKDLMTSSENSKEKARVRRISTIF